MRRRRSFARNGDLAFEYELSLALGIPRHELMHRLPYDEYVRYLGYRNFRQAEAGQLAQQNKQRLPWL